VSKLDTKQEKEVFTMVIYSAARATYMSYIILHRLTRHKNEDAVLLVGNDTRFGSVASVLSDIGVENFEKVGLFTKVVPCNVYPGYPYKNKGIDIIEREIIRGFDRIFKDVGVEVSNKNTFVVLNDCEGDFASYLCLKGISYDHLERVTDCHYAAKVKYSSVISKKFGKDYENFFLRHRVLDGANQYSRPLLLPSSENSIKMFDKMEKSYDFFDRTEALSQLTKEEQNLILKAFKFKWPFVRSTKPICCVIMQSRSMVTKALKKNSTASELLAPISNMIFNGTKIGKFSLSVLPVAIALDYYVEETHEICLIRHPHVTLGKNMFSSMYFHDNVQIAPIMPMDFYRFVKEVNEANIVQTISFASSATDVISKDFWNTMSLTADFWSHFIIYHRLFVTLDIFAKLKCAKLLLIDIATSQATALAKKIKCKTYPPEITEVTSANVGNSILENPFVIIGNWESCPELLIQHLLELPESSTICFINFDQPEFFYIPECEPLLKYFTAIRVKKSKLKEITFEHMKDEIIWVFSKNQSNRSIIKSYFLCKKLYNVGVEIDVRACSSAEKRNILLSKRLELTASLFYNNVARLQQRVLKLEQEINKPTY
jgi:hypothetical protein